MINARRQALFYSNTETLTQKRWRDTMGVKTKLECLPVFITPLTFGWTPKLVGFRAKADGNAQRLAARGANSSILLLGWEFQLLRGKFSIHRRVWLALGISSSACFWSSKWSCLCQTHATACCIVQYTRTTFMSGHPHLHLYDDHVPLLFALCWCGVSGRVVTMPNSLFLRHLLIQWMLLHNVLTSFTFHAG